MAATKKLYERARPIIDRVLDRTVRQQDQLIAEACGADAELAGLVASLLKRRQATLATDEDLDFIGSLTITIADEQLPQEIGNYRIISRLGAGGMSIVYLAEQANPRRLVAIKILYGRHVKAGVLQREVETLARLQHPGIAQVYEAGIGADTDGEVRAYFAMEYVSSTGETYAVDAPPSAKTLLDYVQCDLALPIERRLDLVARVCDAVDYAHKKGVIHLDLKPTNVLVDHLGQPKVIDFGIAQVTDAAREVDDSAGQFIAGTPPYMSPEQLESDDSRIDIRSDVYALGVVMFQVLTERLPFKGLSGDPREDLRILKDCSPSSLAEHLERTPRDLEVIVAKAMARNADARYQSAGALADDIRRFGGKRPVAARSNAIPYRVACLFRRRPVISIASTIAILLIGIASFQAYRANAGAKDALALLLTAMENVDPISSDGSPATLDRFLDSVAEELDERTALHPEYAAKIHVVLVLQRYSIDG